MPSLPIDVPLDLQAIESRASDPRSGGPLVWGQVPSAAERFRLLAHRLYRARANKPMQIVLVTSGTSDEGKSTVAANLAGILARNGARTLLIDADLRAPDLHRMLNLPSLPGLSGVLAGEIALEGAVRRVDPVGLYFLPAGHTVENPVVLFESSCFSGAAGRMRATFEWVIIDSPPLNPLADAQCIATLSDAILLVVRWAFTPRGELDHAITTLEGLPLLGIVVNRFDSWQESYPYARSTRPGVSEASPAPPLRAARK